MKPTKQQIETAGRILDKAYQAEKRAEESLREFVQMRQSRGFSLEEVLAEAIPSFIDKTWARKIIRDEFTPPEPSFDEQGRIRPIILMPPKRR